MLTHRACSLCPRAICSEAERPTFPDSTATVCAAECRSSNTLANPGGCLLPLRILRALLPCSQLTNARRQDGRLETRAEMARWLHRERMNAPIEARRSRTRRVEFLCRDASDIRQAIYPSHPTAGTRRGAPRLDTILQTRALRSCARCARRHAFGDFATALLRESGRSDKNFVGWWCSQCVRRLPAANPTVRRD